MTLLFVHVATDLDETETWLT